MDAMTRLRAVRDYLESNECTTEDVFPRSFSDRFLRSGQEWQGFEAVLRRFGGSKYLELAAAIAPFAPGNFWWGSRALSRGDCLDMVNGAIEKAGKG